MNFEPRRVERGSWRSWLREALELTTRKPVAFVVLTLALGAINLLPHIAGVIYQVFTPLFMGIGCRLAHQADTGGASYRAISGMTARSAAALVAIGVGLVVLFFVFALLLYVLPISSTPLNLAPESSRQVLLFEGGLVLLLWSAIWLGLTLGIVWVVVPLISHADLPLSQVTNQAEEGISKNPIVIRLSAGLGAALFGLLFLGHLVNTGIAAVFAYPFMCCLMYVSYRHIWWDRPKNKPLQSQAGKGVMTPAHTQGG